jgi:tetratricopeptide (TPR) repeat protein
MDLSDVVTTFESESSASSESAPYAVALQNLGLVYYFDGKLEEAARVYEKALPFTQSAWGENSLRAADNMHSIARTLRRSHKYDEAEPYMKRIIEVREKILGPNHFLVANAYLDLAVNYGRQKRLDAAESVFQKVMHMRDKPDQARRLKASLEAYEQFLLLNNCDAETVAKVKQRIADLERICESQPLPGVNDPLERQKLEIIMLPAPNSTGHNESN